MIKIFFDHFGPVEQVISECINVRKELSPKFEAPFAFQTLESRPQVQSYPSRVH